MEKLQRMHGSLPATLMVRTGGGGLHFYFQGNLPSRRWHNELPGIEFQGHGSYVIAPPSRHVSGRLYEWEGEPSIDRIAPVPEFLRKMVVDDRVPYPSQILLEPQTISRAFDRDGWKKILDVIPAEDRDTWFRVGAGIFHGGIPDGFELFHEWSMKSHEKYKGEEDCLRLWKSLESRNTGSIITPWSILHLARKYGPSLPELKIPPRELIRMGEARCQHEEAMMSLVTREDKG